MSRRRLSNDNIESSSTTDAAGSKYYAMATIKIFIITIFVCLGYGLYDQYQSFTLFMRSNNRSLENMDHYIFDNTSSMISTSNIRFKNITMIRSDPKKRYDRTIKNDDTDHRYEPHFIHGGKALADMTGYLLVSNWSYFSFVKDIKSWHNISTNLFSDRIRPKGGAAFLIK